MPQLSPHYMLLIVIMLLMMIMLTMLLFNFKSMPIMTKFSNLKMKSFYYV